MAKRYTDTDKYKKPFVRGLQGAYKVLWDYLYHDCNHAGIWIKDFEIAQAYVGRDLPVNEVDALKYFKNKVVEVHNGEKWFIPSFIDFQYGELSEKNRVHASIIKLLRKEGLDPLTPYKDLARGSRGVKDKDKDMDKDRSSLRDSNLHKNGKKKFIPPSVEDVAAYIKEKNLPFSADAFIDHYQAIGWIYGKDKKPVVDWKACVRTWKNRRDAETTLYQPPKPKQPSEAELFNFDRQFMFQLDHGREKYLHRCKNLGVEPLVPEGAGEPEPKN